MNNEQIKSAVRWVVTTFGASFATYVASKGLVPINEANGFLNSEFFIAGVTSLIAGAINLGMLAWSMHNHTQTNAIVVVDKMNDVAAVVTKATLEGKDLANSIPSSTVIAANDPSINEILKPFKNS